MGGGKSLFEGLREKAAFHMGAAWNAGGNNEPAAMRSHLEQYLETQIKYFRTRPILDNLSASESETFWQYFYSAVNTKDIPNEQLNELARKSGFDVNTWVEILRDVYRE